MVSLSILARSIVTTPTALCLVPKIVPSLQQVIQRSFYIPRNLGNPLSLSRNFQKSRGNIKASACCLRVFSTCVTEVPNTIIKGSDYQKATKIPQYCLQLAEKLAQQPLCLVKRRNAQAEPCQLLYLNRYDDTRIFALFNHNAPQFLTKKESAWQIEDFGGPVYSPISLGDYEVQQGVMLLPDNKFPKCSLATLQGVYDKIFEKLIRGWGMHDVEDEHGFVLFTKEPSLLFNEDTLIRFIVGRLSLGKDVTCHYESASERLHLRVRRSELEQVIEKLGFELYLSSL